MLRVTDLEKRFRGLLAVRNLSFEINTGELVGLIGPNGAGKTTVFNLISGVYRPDKGKIIFKGHDITGKKQSEIARLGLARTFQANELFNNQTCLENVMISSHLQQDFGILELTLGIGGIRSKQWRTTWRAEDMLLRMGLMKVKDQLAESLSQGLKRILGVCNALAAGPILLLLDEPVTGMSYKDIEVFQGFIQEIKSQDVTIMIVEHNLKLVMGICDRIIVMNFGEKIAEGTPQEIKNNAHVIEAYLGG